MRQPFVKGAGFNATDLHCIRTVDIHILTSYIHTYIALTCSCKLHPYGCVALLWNFWLVFGVQKLLLHFGVADVMEGKPLVMEDYYRNVVTLLFLLIMCVAANFDYLLEIG